MKNNKSIFLNQLKDNRHVEIFSLDKADDTIFGNYQRYDFYQVIWFTRVEGNTSYYLDFNEYILEDNQVVIVFPGQIDKLDIRGKEGYIFAINNDTFFRMNQRMNSGFLNGYFSNVLISLDTDTRQALERLTDLLIAEYESENRVALMENYMEAFLYHVSSLFEKTDDFKNKCDSFVSELMILIDLHYKEQRETDFYAEKMSTSCKRINEICKSGTGKTVKQHLQERLILEIKKEIRLGNKSLKEIAFDLGFNEPAYFTRFFKLHTSQTPTDFRDNDPFVQVKGR